MHQLGDKANKFWLSWQGDVRSFALDTLMWALSSSMNNSQDPIYFLSDSSDLVPHVAFELKDKSWLRQRPGTIDRSGQSVVNHLQGAFSRDMSLANYYIDWKKGHSTTGYYGKYFWISCLWCMPSV